MGSEAGKIVEGPGPMRFQRREPDQQKERGLKSVVLALGPELRESMA